MSEAHLIGYSDKFSVRQCDEIDFMISTTDDKYTIDLVSISRKEPSGDDVGLNIRHVPDVTSRELPGRAQRAERGSCVHVPDFNHCFSTLDNWSVHLWFSPTMLNVCRRQILISTFSDASDGGWELYIDHNSYVILRLADGTATLPVRSAHPITAYCWYEILAGYCVDNRTVSVLLREKHAKSFSVHSNCPREAGQTQAGGDLVIGARHNNEGARSPRFTDHYNGKVEDVRIYRMEPRKASMEGSLENGKWTVARWQFDGDFTKDVVEDTGGCGKHGFLINLPTRAVTGHRWTGEFLDFRQHREHYGALHLHEDDQHDAGWEPDVTLTIPGTTPSGTYALRCRSSSATDYIPFTVLPSSTETNARAAVILPSFTYLAYGNTQAALDPDFLNSGKVERPILPSPDMELLQKHPDWGKSLYDLHLDGSGFVYASWKRPIPMLRPAYRNFVTAGPREFSADLCLIYWLEQQNVQFDVLTDNELDLDGAESIEHYDVVLTGSHPEYYTQSMLDALEDYLGNGGNLMYLGGNGFYWVTSVHPHHRDVIEVRRGYAGTRPWTSSPGESVHSTTGEPAGLWRHRGRSPNSLVGVGFTALGWDMRAGHYVRLPESFEPQYRWIFEGVGESEPIGNFGLAMDGAAGDELDRYDSNLGGRDAVRLAYSIGHTDSYCLAVEEIQEASPNIVGTKNESVRSDIVYEVKDGGGAVFSVGSICWVPALPINECENNVSQITRNVLNQFIKRSS